MSYPKSVSGRSLATESSDSTNPMPPNAATRRHGTSLRAILPTRTPSIARMVAMRPAVATWPAALFFERSRSYSRTQPSGTWTNSRKAVTRSPETVVA